MKNLRFAKYLLVYTLPLGVALSFSRTGWQSFMPLIYGFGIIPLLELFIKRDPGNLSSGEADNLRQKRIYDVLVWMVLPVQYFFLSWFLVKIQAAEFLSVTWWGRCASMGLMCGVLGINVAHELGHRRSKTEQLMSKMLLMTSLYPHFFIEHNYGHHKNVATREDPASARRGESLYHFWLRSIFYSYLSAWKIQRQMLKRKKQAFWSLHNEMLRFTAIELLILVLIPISLGWEVLAAFLVAATGGILLLETVNYIEHYGLSRQKVNDRRYEKATPVHSWNSDHQIGRAFLFELSRHSDHHAYPHKKYQLLSHYDESPQMPTGYPGMMLLSTVPPLWFAVMNKRLPADMERVAVVA